MLYLHYPEDSIPNESLGKSLFLTCICFKRREFSLPKPRISPSFWLKTSMSQCVSTRSLSEGHVAGLLLNSPSSQKGQPSDLIKQILKAHKNVFKLGRRGGSLHVRLAPTQGQLCQGLDGGGCGGWGSRSLGPQQQVALGAA